MTDDKADKEHSDVLFDFVVERFQEICKETRQEIPIEDYCTWVEHHNNWIDISKPFMSSFSEFGKYNSILLLRFVELQKQLCLLHFGVLSGLYHQSIRELRYIMESIIQAYYIDREHPEVTIECKLEIIKEIDKLVGGRLIDRTDLEHKKELKALYSDLSKYIHSSYKELKPTIEKGEVDCRVTFAFNKDLFYKCLEFSNRTMDAFFFVILSLYPEIVSKIREDQMLLKSLAENKCALSVKYIKKEGNQ